MAKCNLTFFCVSRFLACFSRLCVSFPELIKQMYSSRPDKPKENLSQFAKYNY